MTLFRGERVGALAVLVVLLSGPIGCWPDAPPAPCKDDKECAPYVCTDGFCLASCDRQADCLQGYQCDLQTAECVEEQTAASCVNDEECGDAAMICLEGLCATTCLADLDCGPDAACDFSDGLSHGICASLGQSGTSTE